MADRKTIYIPDAAAAYLADAEALSSRIAGIVLRYKEMVGRSLPKLSKAQWCAIADANNGTDDLLLGEYAESVGSLLWANVADSIGLAAKWDVDQDELVRTMRAWSYVEQVAAFEALRTFWRNCELETDEALRLAGMIE